LPVKIIALVAVVIFSTAGTMWFAASRQIWSDLEIQQLKKAEQYLRSLSLVYAARMSGAETRIENGRVTRVVSPPLTEYKDFSVVDDSVSYVGGDATIFTFDAAQDKFIRRVTTVKKENGEPAVGTALAPDSPAQAFVRRGEPYYGPDDSVREPVLHGLSADFRQCRQGQRHSLCRRAGCRSA
jgi:methyl-accepting chemotaxis protein